jgi:hypothetical protein
VVEYQTTLAADTGYASPIDDVMLDGGDRFGRALTGLTADTAYRSRARHHDGTTWSHWSEVTWSTLDTPVADPILSAFTAPAYGEPISGVTAALAWELDDGRSVTTIEISSDLGGTWDTLSGATSTGVEFDSTAHADGFTIARLTLDNADVILHPGFLIDNASEATTRIRSCRGRGRVLQVLEPDSSALLLHRPRVHGRHDGPLEGARPRVLRPV